MPALPARPRRPDRPRGMRTGDPGPVPGRAGGGVRVSRRASSPSGSGRRAGSGPTTAELDGRCGAPAAREAAASSSPAAACSMRRPRPPSRAFAARHGIPVGGDAGRQVEPAVRSPAGARSGRRHRHGRRERPRRGGRPGARGRHAPAGFHHGLASAVQGPGRAIIDLNVQAFDAVKHGGAIPRRRTRGSGSNASAMRSRGWRADAAWTRRAADEKARWLEVASRYTGATNVALPSDAAGDRRRAAGERAPPTSWSAPPAALPGELHKLWQATASPSATTSNTAFPAWATRSPAASA